MMMSPNVPFLVFFSLVSCGIVLVFCTIFCKICCLKRRVQLERHPQTCREQENPRSIYFIPFPQSISRHDSEDLHSTSIYDRPPSYNKLGLESDDPPPPYTERDFPENCSGPPRPLTDVELHYGQSCAASLS